MSQQLLIKKDRELVTLRSQAQSLSDELSRTLRTLKDREHENSRLSQQLTDMRDASIQRDLELTTVRQTLGAREAELVRIQAQQQNSSHVLSTDIESLRLEVEEEKSKRMKLSDDKHRMEHDMREQIHRAMEQSRLQEVAKVELMATEEAWIRKVEELQKQLHAKSKDVDTATSALANASEEVQQLQKAMSAQERIVHELQQQVLILSDGEATRSSEQQARLGALITSFNQIRETCEQQSRELTQLTDEKRRLEGDKRSLKERLKDMTSLATTYKSEKDMVSETMNQQVSRLHALQMELTLLQHKTREAGMTGGRFLDTQTQLDTAVSRLGDRFASFMETQGLPSQPVSRTQTTSLDSSGSAYVKSARVALHKLRDSVGALNTYSPTRQGSRAMDFLAHRNDELGRENVALKLELGSRASSRGKR